MTLATSPQSPRVRSRNTTSVRDLAREGTLDVTVAEVETDVVEDVEASDLDSEAAELAGQAEEMMAELPVTDEEIDLRPKVAMAKEDVVLEETTEATPREEEMMIKEAEAVAMAEEPTSMERDQEETTEEAREAVAVEEVAEEAAQDRVVREVATNPLRLPSEYL